MQAAGLDIGGTKIETQLFAADWSCIARHRCATPDSYDALLAAIADSMAWAAAQPGGAAVVGIGTAGRMHPKTGVALTANLAASGHRFQADIEAHAGRTVRLVNDSAAFALSEALFGAGRGHARVAALILGTGVGGGFVQDGRLAVGASGMGGEFGHTALPAHVVTDLGLPILPCGCGRMGCVETYASGPGLERLARHLTGQALPARHIAEQRHGALAPVWQAWCRIVGDLIHSLTLTLDPDIVVLGGGLSNVPGIAQDVSAAAQAAQLAGFPAVPVARAEGGDDSGARGAAYAATIGGQA